MSESTNVSKRHNFGAYALKDDKTFEPIRNYFVQDVPKQIGEYSGISASVIDITEYNRLARMRGFMRIKSDYDMAYLVYTHRGIYKSLKFHPKRHLARWDTVRSAIDQVFGQGVLSIPLGEDLEDSSALSLKFDHCWIPLHDLTTNAYDEIHKLELYMDLRRGSLHKVDQYDVLSLANATPDFAVLGFEAHDPNEKSVSVLVHRTRGSWVQIASLVLVKLLGPRDKPLMYTLSKDLSVYKLCYDDLGRKLDRLGFLDQDWRDCCVSPDILESQVRLTFEDYMWEFFNMYIDGLHPYQQSVVMLLSGAVRQALYGTHININSNSPAQSDLVSYVGNGIIGPYLLLVKRMLVDRTLQNSFISEAFGGLAVTRVDFILGTWLAYVNAVNLLIRELTSVNLEDYVQSVSPEPMISHGQKKVIIAFSLVTALFFFCALFMIIGRYRRRRKAFYAQRQQALMFYTLSSGAYDETDVDSSSSGGTAGSLKSGR
ncbi:uncharacterized protein BXIN_2929 [Babesia sp. Xinjiang]|uniref:uncharacterized protein n=1 Tax=Babesia sp. Xinjiang TaxID=462227 RepID=UPI000A24506C|nr:uncharacterized protein BXIN_2929 [Babesia sp. Xinjiang]ORM39545.1 hypothetical protein BXIN_2929 [Babesia sp. Xinjiang]